MIGALIEHGCGRDGHELLQMKWKGCKPNTITYMCELMCQRRGFGVGEEGSQPCP